MVPCISTVFEGDNFCSTRADVALMATHGLNLTPELRHSAENMARELRKHLDVKYAQRTTVESIVNIATTVCLGMLGFITLKCEIRSTDHSGVYREHCHYCMSWDILSFIT